MKTESQQMEEDLRRGETREVEFKSWLNVVDPAHSRKIMRSIAAMANRGGGRIYFGVDDDGTPLPPDEQFPRALFTAEPFHRMMKKFVHPELECEVRWVTISAGTYPVLYVPSHGEIPVTAQSDNGDQQVYVRGNRPEVMLASTPSQWEELFASVMRVRDKRRAEDAEEVEFIKVEQISAGVAAKLDNRFTSALAAALSGRKVELPDWTLIKALAEDVRSDFSAQIASVDLEGNDVDLTTKALGLMPLNNSLQAYALLDEDGNLIAPPNLMGQLRSASRQMRSIAYDGYSDFITLTDPAVAPRGRQIDIAGHQYTAIEGARADRRQVIGATVEYWRAYRNGVFVICKSYDEDLDRVRSDRRPYLTTIMTLMRTHGILSHAFLMAYGNPSVDKIALLFDPCGLAGRPLLTSPDGDHYVVGRGIVSDRFGIQVLISKGELFDDYLGTLSNVLKEVSEPFSDLYGGNWFTRDRVAAMFNDLENRGITMKAPTMQEDHG